VQGSRQSKCPKQEDAARVGSTPAEPHPVLAR
jgi:hypothetical protein